MTHIKEASISDIPGIQAIAEKTWWPTYKDLLSAEQIKYMLQTIYASETLSKVMADGSQNFLMIYENDAPAGFGAYGPRPENPSISKLYKLYIDPAYHGKGFGKMLIDDIKERLIRRNIHILDLNVKRDNPARKFYEKLGFSIIREEDIPLGPYTLNDFVMRITF